MKWPLEDAWVPGAAFNRRSRGTEGKAASTSGQQPSVLLPGTRALCGASESHSEKRATDQTVEHVLCQPESLHSVGGPGRLLGDRTGTEAGKSQWPTLDATRVIVNTL